MKYSAFLFSLLTAMLSPACVYADDVTPKAVLVTGANSGIGLRITELLSSNGYLVYAGARKEEDLKRLNAMENVEAVRLDVTLQSDIDAAVKQIQERGRGLYGLVNNAGIATAGPLIEAPIEELIAVFDVNVYGPYRVTQSFAPMIIQSKGRIVNISSITGIFSGSMGGHYGMSKHALEAFTDSLAAEMQRFDVYVSAVEPGSYASNSGKAVAKRLESRANWRENSAYASEQAFMKSAMANGAAGKDPEDVAKAVMDALSSSTPKRRYLVVGDALTASLTIGNALQRVLQLNQGQAYTMSREQLIKMLDEQQKKLD